MDMNTDFHVRVDNLRSVHIIFTWFHYELCE